MNTRRLAGSHLLLRFLLPFFFLDRKPASIPFLLLQPSSSSSTTTPNRTTFDHHSSTQFQEPSSSSEPRLSLKPSPATPNQSQPPTTSGHHPDPPLSSQFPSSSLCYNTSPLPETITCNTKPITTTIHPATNPFLHHQPQNNQFIHHFPRLVPDSTIANCHHLRPVLLAPLLQPLHPQPTNNHTNHQNQPSSQTKSCPQPPVLCSFIHLHRIHRKLRQPQTTTATKTQSLNQPNIQLPPTPQPPEKPSPPPPQFLSLTTSNCLDQLNHQPPLSPGSRYHHPKPSNLPPSTTSPNPPWPENLTQIPPPKSPSHHHGKPEASFCHLSCILILHLHRHLAPPVPLPIA